MRYLRVRWLHNDPVEMISEIDEAGYEMRKVEIFVDGSKGFAGPSETFHGTQLGDQPIPSLEVIAADSQFQPVQISKDEFEKSWANRFSAKVSA